MAADEQGRSEPLGDENPTVLLQRVRAGEAGAAERLFELVYGDLRALAARFLSHERRDHTLHPTALVGEAWLRLFGEGEVDWRDRAHFFGTAARCLRQALVAHARERAALKRGGGWERIALDDIRSEHADAALDVLELDEALERLSELDERRARVVELRFFGGLSVEETSEALGVAPRTVKSDWQIARMWLHRELEAPGGE